MKIFSRSKDGGPDSPVDAFFLVEIKSLFSVALLRFNEGGREAYHTHAFNAWTWFLLGDLVEQDHDGTAKTYRRSVLPKRTVRTKNHRVLAHKTSWCFTIRGPWTDRWTEDTETHHTVLSHGRKIVERTKR